MALSFSPSCIKLKRFFHLPRPGDPSSPELSPPRFGRWWNQASIAADLIATSSNCRATLEQCRDQGEGRAMKTWPFYLGATVVCQMCISTAITRQFITFYNWCNCAFVKKFGGHGTSWELNEKDFIFLVSGLTKKRSTLYNFILRLSLSLAFNLPALQDYRWGCGQPHFVLMRQWQVPFSIEAGSMDWLLAPCGHSDCQPHRAPSYPPRKTMDPPEALMAMKFMRPIPWWQPSKLWRWKEKRLPVLKQWSGT